jgi:hypothetical protein
MTCQGGLRHSIQRIICGKLISSNWRSCKSAYSQAEGLWCSAHTSSGGCNWKPHLMRGDMAVLPNTDERFFVSDSFPVLRKPGTSVNTVTVLKQGESGFAFQQGRTFIYSPPCSDWHWGWPSLIINGYLECLTIWTHSNPPCTRCTHHKAEESREDGGHTPCRVPSVRMKVTYWQTQTCIGLEPVNVTTASDDTSYQFISSYHVYTTTENGWWERRKYLLEQQRNWYINTKRLNTFIQSSKYGNTLFPLWCHSLHKQNSN